MNLNCRLIIAVIGWLALVIGAPAADTSGKILGTVKDPAGNVIPRVGVALTTWP